ncbi:hypothetical protein DITRI_Ditri01bG0184400 [Diplodiscus trichospermus]
MQFSTLHVLFILALFSLAYAAFSFKSPLPCSDDFLGIDTYLEMKARRNTTKCKKLSTLQAQFAWNYDITGHNQTQINVLIGTKVIADIRWLAWGVNPDQPHMVGTRAIIAINAPNESTPVVHTYSISEDTKKQCAFQPSDIDLQVQNMTAENVAGVGFFTMCATLILPGNYNISRLNHLWQVGYVAEGLEPKMHSTSLQNFDSKEILDLKTGQFQDVGHNRQQARKVRRSTKLKIQIIILFCYQEMDQYFPRKKDLCFFLQICKLESVTLSSSERSFCSALLTDTWNAEHHRMGNIIAYWGYYCKVLQGISI